MFVDEIKNKAYPIDNELAALESVVLTRGGGGCCTIPICGTYKAFGKILHLVLAQQKK